jgi:hypothetical protein
MLPRVHFTQFGGQWNYPQDRGTRPNTMSKQEITV